MRSLQADADCVGLASNTVIADIDIVIASGELIASLRAQCDVLFAGGIAKERRNTVGRIAATSCIIKERQHTIGRVDSRIAKERRKPSAPLPLPVVLLPSAPTPLAVLSLPVVLAKSATKPFAMLKLPIVLLSSAPPPVAVFPPPVVLL